MKRKQSLSLSQNEAIVLQALGKIRNHGPKIDLLGLSIILEKKFSPEELFRTLSALLNKNVIECSEKKYWSEDRTFSLPRRYYWINRNYLSEGE